MSQGPWPLLALGLNFPSIQWRKRNVLPHGVVEGMTGPNWHILSARYTRVLFILIWLVFFKLGQNLTQPSPCPPPALAGPGVQASLGPHGTVSEGCWRKGSFSSSLSRPLQARLFTVATGGERQGVRARQVGRGRGEAWAALRGAGDPEGVGGGPGWTPSPLPSLPQSCHWAATSAKVTPRSCPAQTPWRAGSRSSQLAEEETREALSWDPQVTPFLGQMWSQGLSAPPPPLCQIGPLGWPQESGEMWGLGHMGVRER